MKDKKHVTERGEHGEWGGSMLTIESDLTAGSGCVSVVRGCRDIAWLGISVFDKHDDAFPLMAVTRQALGGVLQSYIFQEVVLIPKTPIVNNETCFKEDKLSPWQ